MLTIEQATARKQYLGSSEIAAVMGCDPWKSAADVYLEKRGLLNPFEGNEATERGQLLEPVILDWAEGELGKEFRRDVMKVHANGMLCTNFDGLIQDDSDPEPTESVEAKSTVSDEEWGEPGTDAVPPRVILQCHMGFACLPSLRGAWVPMITPGYKKFDWRLYRVERDDEIVAAVEAAGVKFVEGVREGVQPEDYRPSMDVLRRMRREVGKAVPVTQGTFEKWIVLNAAALQAKDDAEAAKAALIAEMQDGDGCLVNGRLAATFLEQTRKSYVVAECKFRVLRLKKAK